MRSKRSERLASRFCAYSSAVTPSIPGAPSLRVAVGEIDAAHGAEEPWATNAATFDEEWCLGLTCFGYDHVIAGGHDHVGRPGHALTQAIQIRRGGFGNPIMASMPPPPRPARETGAGTITTIAEPSAHESKTLKFLQHTQ